uniref:Uncharacterized protein n=1 Tax=Arundo donax TaxID=35708 RepID=A0A0A9B494_ARUDO
MFKKGKMSTCYAVILFLTVAYLLNCSYAAKHRGHVKVL